MADMKRWFENPANRNWLIIFDSVDPSPGEEAAFTELLERALPMSDHGSIILTTRSRSFVRFGRGYGVLKMDREDAIMLLDRRMHTSLPTYSAVAGDSSEILRGERKHNTRLRDPVLTSFSCSKRKPFGQPGWSPPRPGASWCLHQQYRDQHPGLYGALHRIEDRDHARPSWGREQKR